MRYSIEYSCVSNIGKVRCNNQDNFICDNKYMRPVDDRTEFPINGTKDSSCPSMFGIFDGMGGEECGEMASFIASEQASKVALKKKAVNVLDSFCRTANRTICDYAKSNGIYSMGTTAAIIVFTKRNAVLCNVGDSRIYVIHSNGELKQLSTDHVALAPYGRKPPLYQNLGIPEDELVIEPSYMECKYNEGDTYIICSDGLTDMVSEEIIAKEAIAEDVNTVVANLLQLALEAGGRDNITIIACKISKAKCTLFGKVTKEAKKNNR